MPAYVDYTRWTDEMKERLVSLFRRGFSALEIAEQMGLDFKQVSYAIKRAKGGHWGAELQRRILWLPPETPDALENLPPEVAEELAHETTEEPQEHELTPEEPERLTAAMEAAEEGAEQKPPAGWRRVLPVTLPEPTSFIRLLEHMRSFTAERMGADSVTSVFASEHDRFAEIYFSADEREYIMTVKENRK